MALITTPVFSTALVHGPTVRSRGNIRRIVHDLTAAYGAFVLVRLGRGGTAALDVGVGVRVNRLIAYTEDGSGPLPYSTTPGAYVIGHLAPLASVVSAIEAAVQSTVSVDEAAGSLNLTLTSATGFAAGDVITICGAGSASYARWEVNRVDRVQAGGILYLETPLLFAHTAVQADVVLNKGEMWALEVDGGSQIEIIVDYGAATVGDAIDVEIFVQTYLKDSTQ